MQSIKYWIVASILLATTSRSEIIIADRQDFAPAVGALINIVKSCYAGHIDGIGIIGNVPESLIRALAQHSIPVTLIDVNVKSVAKRYKRAQFRHELRVFIVGPTSIQNLYDILVASMTYGVWWDHMASYFILDSSPRCHYPEVFVNVAWILNIINAKVMCLGSSVNKTIIIGFNPFTSEAPAPWVKGRVHYPKNENPFTIFVMRYQKFEATCTNLDFDKTTDLGESVFQICDRPLTDGVIAGQFSYNFFTTNERIKLTILDVLHAKPKYLNRCIWNVGDVNGMSFYPTGIVFYNTSDYLTYPHGLNGFVIVTKFRGNKSQLNKILTVVDIYTRYGIGVVYLITLIFLKIFAHQTIVPVLLNLVRITCGTGFENLPNNTASRIFLTGLLFFVVMILGIYQGNLASLLTRKIPLRNVNTMKDLVDLGYDKIYVFKNDRFITDRAYVHEHSISVRSYVECIRSVTNDSSAACINMIDGSIDLAIREKLHVGNKIIAPVYISFPIRRNFPVKDRVNKVIARMVESSVLEPWAVKCNPVRFTDFEIDEEVKANVNFKIIELREVAFSFVILGIGLLCASISFVFELMVHRYQSRVSRVRVQVLN